MIKMCYLCYNCSSDNIILTNENFTCVDCSHVQLDVFYLEERKFTGFSPSASDFINEFHQRENLSEEERNIINERLDRLKSMKSAFSKLEISLGLVYITKVEKGSVRSLQAFLRTHGDLVCSKKMELCLKHVKHFLKLPQEILDWRVLLEPYCQKYNLLKDKDMEVLKLACEKIHERSCMNIFSVAATAVACYFDVYFPLDKEKNLISIAIFSKISKSTLKKKCKEYSKGLF